MYKNKQGGGEKRKTGAIVMNCNPFTNGHLCLIQNAAKKVEDLYIFVVEENRSYFRFEDRFLMVQEGTWALDNVYVVPSGNWVLSYKTFPAYFEKEDIQEVKIDAKFDLEIFARYIAPKLGITKRFAGEEPIDKITRQYNEQMREVLTLFDIEFEEVPRMRIHNEVVSASRARQCILEEKWEELRYLIPESSYKICRERGYFCKKN